MPDFTNDLDLIDRKTGLAGKAHTVTLSRSYDAAIDDVWDAISNPDRLKRWFLPVTGEFRLGGKYQIEGNAGGEILVCDAPTLLKVTWVYGEQAESDISEVVVRLCAKGAEETHFELEHTATVDPSFWGQFGPGAVGVGWDLTLLGLGLHLQGGSIGDPNAWQSTPEAREFMTRSSQLWGAAHLAAGADAEHVESSVENTTKFYAPDPE
jgi:uncharacterized protein YndB with AHSA1/START domain